MSLPLPPRALPAAAVLALTTGLCTAVGVSSAQAVSPDVVLSEVYGGGGNSGAPYNQDFIELRNDSTTTVDLTGWSVQYASASGTTWQATLLSGNLDAGEHLLVGEAKGTTGADLPQPDITGHISLSGSNGKVALVETASPLTCGSECAGTTGVRDFVGYGTANDHEGSASAPATSNPVSVQRIGADTDSNGTDFVSAAPTPQASDPAAEPTTIAQVQGAAHRSPLEGGRVTGVEGVVTATSGNGFWMQDPTPDADPRTSDAVLVFTRTTPTVAVGDAVSVSGTVAEYRPGGSSSDNLTTTEIDSPMIVRTAVGQPLPTVTSVGVDGSDADRHVPATVIEDDASGSVETSGEFDPAEDGIDFWESLEGMRVGIGDAQVVGPTNRFDQTAIVPPGAGVRTERGGILLRREDPNPERILVDTPLADVPVADVGDSFTDVVGIVDYSFANFHLLATSSPELVDGGLTRETTTLGGDELSAATFNVENLDPTDPAEKFASLAEIVVDNLQAPDLVALEEVQDDNGSTDDAVVSAEETLTRLTDEIVAQGGPQYSWTQIDPVDDQDGGEPGGNIRVAFLYRTDTGLGLVERDRGGTTEDTDVESGPGGVQLTHSPGRVSPQADAWAATRKPLAAQFTWHERTIIAVANHFSSKGGDDPLFGRTQPPVLGSEDKRVQQAALVRDFVDEVAAVDPDARVLVLGDLNDFEFSPVLDELVGTGEDALVDLPRTLPENERYTYVYQGNSQVLDHIVVSRQLAADGYEYDIVHVNAEFTDQVSDHDPQVVRLDVPLPRATSLSLTAIPRSRVFGDDQRIRLSGDLNIAGDADPAGQQVTLQSRPFGESGWSDVAARQVGDGGGFAFVRRPEQTTTWRVVYTGPRDAASVSREVRTPVRFAVTARLDDRRVERGETARIRGVVAPAARGEIVRLQRRTASGWNRVDTSTVRRYGEYVTAYTPRRGRDVELRVRKLGNGSYARNTSAPVTLRVR